MPEDDTPRSDGYGAEYADDDGPDLDGKRRPPSRGAGDGGRGGPDGNGERGRPDVDGERGRPDPDLERAAEEARDRQWVADQMTDALRDVPADQVPARLCDACLRVLPVSGASISIADGADVRATLCATDRVAADLAEIQFTLGDGPCVEASTLRSPVFAPDLNRGPDAARWPVFAAQAVEAGAAAMFSMPLGNAATAVGTVDLYCDEPGPLSEREVRLAMLAADAVTLAMTALHLARSGEDEGVAGWLDDAETGHDEVHQATGMVMMQLDVGVDVALDRLRAHAFAHDRTATEVARDVLARRIDFRDGG